MDPSVLSNFTPFSTFPFLSKVLDWSQLPTFSGFSIYEKFQFGFQPRHSTETSRSRISTVLALLDSSAAFDSVDQSII